MNTTFKFLLLSCLIFAGSVKASLISSHVNDYQKQLYENYLYKHLWCYSKGFYQVPNRTIDTPVKAIILYRAATLQDVAERLHLSPKTILKRMKMWNLKIPKE